MQSPRCGLGIYLGDQRNDYVCTPVEHATGFNRAFVGPTTDLTMSTWQDHGAVVVSHNTHIHCSECDEQLPNMRYNRNNLHNTFMARKVEEMMWTAFDVVHGNSVIDEESEPD